MFVCRKCMKIIFTTIVTVHNLKKIIAQFNLHENYFKQIIFTPVFIRRKKRIKVFGVTFTVPFAGYAADADMVKGEVGHMEELGITESFLVKRQVLLLAAEAAEMILRVDDIIRAQPRSLVCRSCKLKLYRHDIMATNPGYPIS